MPSEVEENVPFEVHLRYEVPSNLGQVQLRCELKNRENVVLQGKSALISGKGSHRFQLIAPQVREAGVIFLAGWMGEHWTQSVCPIVHGDEVMVLSREKVVQRERQKNEVDRLLEDCGYRVNEAGNAALFWERVPGFHEKRAVMVRELVEEHGLSVTLLGAEQMSNPFLLRPDRFQVLLLTSAWSVPRECAVPVERYLRQGGRILALGTPAFQAKLFKVGHRYLDEEALRERLRGIEPARIMVDFSREDLNAWERAACDMERPFLLEKAPGHDGREDSAVHIRMPQYGGWDGARSPSLNQPFAEGATLTCFWAKGGERTREMLVEWVEIDGARWMATVPLSQEWSYVVLLPEEFHFWKDCPAQNRGGLNDRFRPEQAHRLALGLADTHNAVPHGEHEFWVEGIACARRSFEELDLAVVPVPSMEGLCPGYKFYPCRDTARLQANPGQRWVTWKHGSTRELSVLSHHPRPAGSGFQKGRRFRWIPLVEALGPDGEHRGSPAAVWIFLEGPNAGSVVVSMAVNDDVFYEDEENKSLIEDLIGVLLQPVFLAEGGAQYNAYFRDDREIRLGAEVMRLGSGPWKDARIKLALLDAERSAEVFSETLEVGLKQGRKNIVEAVWHCKQGLPSSRYQAGAELWVDGTRVDHLEHEVLVWKPREHPKYMTRSKGQFWLGDKPWYPHGINYMPSTGIATEDNEYFEYWLEARSYDPQVVERDLARIRAMGMNMVSVFIYHRSLESRNLLDLLVRCERHGLRVNLSLRPGTPMEFLWDQMREIIEAYRLPLHDNLFAYDLAWEPVHGNHEQRKIWDEQWILWVEKNHGSVVKAETTWGSAMPRENGELTHPGDPQVSREGPWKKMVVDYRRFLNELLRERYGRARDLVKSVDPYHLVSFRKNVSGDPTVDPAHTLAYDFRGLAGAVDIWCPEGYGRIGDWERVKPGCFTAALARMTDPDLPIMWAEFGMSVWDRHREEPSEQMLEVAGRFYRDFYEMVLLSGANGSVCWYYPGGFRVGENSDYGIIHPDGTWRPASHAIFEYAEKMGAREALPEPEETLIVDLDDYASGIYGLYRDIEGVFWEKMGTTTPGLIPRTP